MKTFFLSFFVVLFLSNSFLFAQANDKPIVVSPLIGDTLSLQERDYYNMFSNIENFQWAVFYLNPDSTLRAKVSYLNEEILIDTVVHIVKSLEYLRDYIKACNKPGSIVQPRVDNYKGAEIIVSRKNGTEATGNLLAVRQSSILLYHQDCDDEVIDINCVNKFNGSDIQKVIIPGQSNVGWGVGIGLLLGTAVAVIGSAGTYESYGEGISSGITFFSIGVVIAAAGTIIGFATSTPDMVIEPFSENDIKGLSVYSRYPKGEPDDLKKIK